MKLSRSRVFCAISLGTLLLSSASVLAQNSTPDPVALETARLTAEAALRNAEASVITAERSRITALDLPMFDGVTTGAATGGTLEANMLAASALGHAAAAIAADLQAPAGQRYVVLTSDATPNIIRGQLFSRLIATMNTELNRIHPDSDPALAGGGIGTGLALLTQFAGLLRSETELSYAATAGMDADLLAMAVARRLGPRAVIPANLLGLGEAGNQLVGDFDALAERIALIQRLHARRAYTGNNLAVFQAVTARFTSFRDTVTKADAQGVTPLHEAARLMGIYQPGMRVLRLEVQAAGGSLVNSSNIGTFFGADPLRVSGGVVASYSVVDTETGQVTAGDVLTCRTTFASIRRIQNGTAEIAGANPAMCRRTLGN